MSVRAAECAAPEPPFTSLQAWNLTARVLCMALLDLRRQPRTIAPPSLQWTVEYVERSTKDAELRGILAEFRAVLPRDRDASIRLLKCGMGIADARVLDRIAAAAALEARAA